MTLSALTNLIATVRQLEPTREIVIFGSSSFLANFPNASPASIGVEVTIDADFFIEPDDEMARTRLLDVMGRGHSYHNENGFYCDFVDARKDEWFPPGWKQRLVAFPGHAGVFAMHPVDATATKLVATAHARVDKRMGRRPHDRGSKDIDTVVALVRSRYVDWSQVKARMNEIDLPPAYLAALDTVEKEVLNQVSIP